MSLYCGKSSRSNVTCTLLILVWKCLMFLSHRRAPPCTQRSADLYDRFVVFLCHGFVLHKPPAILFYKTHWTFSGYFDPVYVWHPFNIKNVFFLRRSTRCMGLNYIFVQNPTIDWRTKCNAVPAVDVLVLMCPRISWWFSMHWRHPKFDSTSLVTRQKCCVQGYVAHC